jgi:hypothetical protein
MKFVVIESPYAGDVNRNTAYAKAAMLDSLLRGEAPFASHLLYTQVLDDTKQDQRDLGINAGLALCQKADLTAVYHDLGISNGMSYGISAAFIANREVQYRKISPEALAAVLADFGPLDNPRLPETLADRDALAKALQGLTKALDGMHEAQRREFWAKAWCSVASAWNSHDRRSGHWPAGEDTETCTRWADRCLKAFDERFTKPE